MFQADVRYMNARFHEAGFDHVVDAADCNRRLALPPFILIERGIGFYMLSSRMDVWRLTDLTTRTVKVWAVYGRWSVGSKSVEDAARPQLL
jgi:hypothetical protein